MIYHYSTLRFNHVLKGRHSLHAFHILLDEIKAEVTPVWRFTSTKNIMAIFNVFSTRIG